MSRGQRRCQALLASDRQLSLLTVSLSGPRRSRGLAPRLCILQVDHTGARGRVGSVGSAGRFASLSATRTRTLTRHGGAARLSMDCSAPVTRAIAIWRFTDLVASRSRPRRSSAWAGVGISNGMSNTALLVEGSGAANGGSTGGSAHRVALREMRTNDAEDGASGSEVHEAVREI